LFIAFDIHYGRAVYSQWRFTISYLI
jgi:hypothetical protein